MKEVQEVLLHFSSSILGLKTEEEILWDLAKNCIHKLSFVDCVIYLIDQKTGHLVQKAAYGSKNPKDYQIYRPIKLLMGQGIVGCVAKSGIPEIVNDTSLDSRYIVDDEKRLSEIAIPIVHKKKILGVIDSEHPEKGFYNEHHQMVLSIIGSICANKIMNVRWEKKFQRKQADLRKIEKQLIELKLAQFQSQLNPHFIFNSLNAIQYFIVTNNKQLSFKYLSKFSRIIRYFLENVNKEISTLDKEVQMLMLYLELESIRFGDKFTYYIKPIPELNNKSIRIPFLLIQPFVEEAIEKRILGGGIKGHLDIDFFHETDHLYCSIIDSGISQKDANKLIKVKNLLLEPTGVEIAMQRIHDLNQSNPYKIKISYHAIKTLDRKKKGTKVLICFPLT